MRNKFLKCVIGLVAVRAALVAQPAAGPGEVAVGRTVSDPSSRSVLGGPWLGLVFDREAAGLRTITGVPGAAHLGPPLDLGMRLAWAAVSPRLDHVFAASPDSEELLLFQVRNGTIARRSLPGAPSAPDRIAFSPSGAAAVLYYPATGEVRILSGPEGLAPMRAFDLPAAPKVLAVSDDAQVVLVTVAAPNETQTLLWTSDGGVRRMFGVSGAVAAAFLRGSRDGVIADAPSRRLYRFHPSGDTLEVLADFEAGTGPPVALSLSADNRRVFAVSADANRVEVLDLALHATTRLECACGPSGLTAMGGSLFRLTDGDGRRFWLLDGNAANPRILFVPIEQPKSEASHD